MQSSINKRIPLSPSHRSAASLILRGPTDAYCDEMERSAHDALCCVRRVLEGGRAVPGGGAVEAALSIYLENFATTLVRGHACYLFFLYCIIFHTYAIYVDTFFLVFLFIYLQFIAHNKQIQEKRHNRNKLSLD